MRTFYYIYSVFICKRDHPLSVFHVGHYLMTKDDINIYYVTHDIINLLSSKILWKPLLLFCRNKYLNYDDESDDNTVFQIKL